MLYVTVHSQFFCVCVCVFILFIYLNLCFFVPAFVTKLVTREDIMLENVNTSPKPKDVESNLDSDGGTGRDFCTLDVNNKGIDYALYLLFNLFRDCNMTPCVIIPINMNIAVISVCLG